MTVMTRAPDAAIADLIEQIGGASRGDAFEGGLNPAQWSALRYFSRANRYSRTVGAFAEFHGTTRGTASQTVTALVRKGYVQRRPFKGDRRSARLELTRKARVRIGKDPLRELMSAAGRLPPEESSALVKGLEAMLAIIRESRDASRFGFCTSCGHLRLNEDGGGGLPYLCQLLGEPLKHEETEQICVNFLPFRAPEANAFHP